ncbi:galactokinase [Parvularcula lutaonensis]|uniref:Galactokinase n=1 Tax=Parvularcula lutaonensis TaxID=491923 RepID=A0ABV7MAE7_9PROT|nr:galactokinase [Parvularcula lutaonensis]GGY37824.1 galactokinase [Parvularcula lutaonensis]
MTIEELFRKRFGAEPEAVARAPGRVNLIGEHIDYNGGAVLPFPISRGVTVGIQLTEEPVASIASDRFPDMVTARLEGEMREGWARYAFYAIRLAKDLGWFSGGARLAITSDLSDGAGLSSSAALCVAVLKALRSLSQVGVTDVEIAKLARRVENEFIGMPCGIMDQMAVAIVRPGEALFLDTVTLEFETIPLPDGYDFIALHSGVHRELADGRYRARKEECDVAKEVLGTDNLCTLDLAEIEKASLPDSVRRRVRHCITEHRRVGLAAEALRKGDAARLGRLMNESHASMRDDFEMSLPAIDALVATALAEGAAGARLTGGGFGGCIVACVEAAASDAWQQRVLRQHPEAFAIEDR